MQLVAHRGYPLRYPENCLVGFRAAVKAGARWLETDIQLSQDQVPVLYHDGTLERTSNLPTAPWDHSADELYRIGASYSKRFEKQFAQEPIISLAQFVAWAADLDDVQLLIELKKESLEQFGMETTVAAVVKELRPITSRCTIISKDVSALQASRTKGGHRIGWVLPNYDDAHHDQAQDLEPEFLICKSQRLPQAPQPLWSGPWQWMVYPINDPDEAKAHTQRGIGLIETDEIGGMQTGLGFN